MLRTGKRVFQPYAQHVVYEALKETDEILEGQIDNIV